MNKINNGKYIYDFTRDSLQEACNDTDKLTQRLITIGGFSGIFVKFALDPLLYSSSSNSYKVIISLKIIATICFGWAILYCLQGLKPTQSGEVSDGNTLVKELWNESEDLYMTTVINQMTVATEQILKTIEDKQYYIRQAVNRNALGVLLLGISAMIKFYFNIS